MNQVHEEVNHTWKGEMFCKRWIIQEYVKETSKGETCMKGDSYMNKMNHSAKGESFRNRWMTHEKVNYTLKSKSFRKSES